MELKQQSKFFEQLPKFLDELVGIDDREKAFEKIKEKEFVEKLIEFIDSEIHFAAISDKHYNGLIYLLPMTTNVLKTLIRLNRFSPKEKEKIIAIANKSLISSIDSIVDFGTEESISDDFINKLKTYKENIYCDLKYRKEELESDRENIDERKRLNGHIQQCVEISKKLSQIDKLFLDIDQLIEGLNGN